MNDQLSGVLEMAVSVPLSSVDRELNKIQRRFLDKPINPSVNLEGLHGLNRVIDSKIQHIGLLNRTEIRPVVNLQGFSTFEYRLNQIRADIEKNPVQLLDKNADVKSLERIASSLKKGILGSSKINLEVDEKSLSTTIERAVRKGTKEGAGGISSKLLDGVFLSVGQGLGKAATKALKEEFGKDAGQIAAKLIGKSVAPVKLFVTNNQELKAEVASLSREIGSSLSGAGKGLALGIIKALKLENATIKEQLSAVIASAAPAAKQAAQEVRSKVKVGAPKVAKSIANEQSLAPFVSAADQAIRNSTNKNIKEESIPRAQERARQIVANGKTRQGGKDTGLVADKDTSELIIVVGGYAGARGLSGKRLQSDLKKDLNPDQKVIWVANPESDLPKSALSSQSKKAGALIGSLATPHVQGYSADAVEVAAQAMAARAKNPNINIKIVGESGGSYVAELAAKTLADAGHKNVSYLGVGAPDFIGRSNAPGQKIISPDEYLGAENARLYGKLGLSRSKSRSQQILGVNGHPFEHYKEANPAELQNFLKGSPKSFGADELEQIKKAADAFTKLDLSSSSPKELEKTAKSAYQNLQTIRRHLLVTAGKENIELQAIADKFQSVYVAASPDPSQLGQARIIAKKAAELVNQVADKPRVEAAVIATTATKEIEAVTKELDTLYGKSVGTTREKYKQVSAQLKKASAQLKAAAAPTEPVTQELKLVNLPVAIKPEPEKESLLTVATNKAAAAASNAAISRVNSQLARSTQANTIEVSPRQINSLKDINPGDLAHMARLGLIDASFLAGKGVSVLKGAEKGLFTALPFLPAAKSIIQNTALPAAAFGAATQIPGIDAAGHGLAQGLSSIANIPLQSLAGQTTEAIVNILQASIGKMPGVGSGLVLEMAKGISLTLAGGAAGTAGTLGSILAPILGGKLLLKAGVSATNQLLPGLNQEANPGAARFAGRVSFAAIAAGEQRFRANRSAKQKQLKSKNPEGQQLAALPAGEDILDAEIIEDPTLRAGVQRNQLLPQDDLGRLKALEQKAAAAQKGISGLYAGLKKKVTALKRKKGTAEEVAISLGGFNNSLEKEILEINASMVEAATIRDRTPIGSIENVEASNVIKRLALKKGGLKQHAGGLKDQQQTLGRSTELIKKELNEDQQNAVVEQLLDRKILKKSAIAAGAGTGAVGLIATLFSGAANAATGAGALGAGAGLAGLLPILLPLLGAGALGAGAYGLGKKLFAATEEQERRAQEQLNKRRKEASGDGFSLNSLAQNPEYENRKSKKFGSSVSPLRSFTQNQPGEANQVNQVNPTETEKEAQAAIQKNSFRLPKIIGTAIGGFVALQVLPVLAGAILSIASTLIGKEIERQRLLFALRAISNSGTDADRTVLASKRSADATKTSELASLEGFTKLKAAFKDSTSEGLSDDLAAGTLSFAKVRGTDRAALQRGFLGLAQTGENGILNAENTNQIGENLPGARPELAAGLGLTTRQLKIQSRGGLDSGVALGRLAGRFKASGDYEQEAFLKTPIAKIDNFQNAIEKLQLTIGDKLLEPLATGADLASGAIGLLSNNMDLLIKAGVAGLTLIGVSIFNAIGGVSLLSGGWKILTTLMSQQSFASIGKGISGAISSPIGLATLQTALLTAAITAAFDAYSFLNTLFTGANTPGKRLADDMIQATDSIDKANDALIAQQGLVPLRDLVKQFGSKGSDDLLGDFVTQQQGGEDSEEAKRRARAVNAQYLPQRNFLEVLLDTGIDKFFQQTQRLSGRNRLGTFTSEAKSKASNDALREGLSTLQAKREANPDLIDGVKIDEVKLNRLRKEQQRLKTEESSDRGLDAVAQKRRTLAKIAIDKQIRELEQPLQSQQKGLEKNLETLRATLENPSIDDDIKKSASDNVEFFEAALGAVTKQLSKVTKEVTESALRTEQAAARYQRVNIQIERDSLRASTAITREFTGSLFAGLQATKEFTQSQITIDRKIVNTEQAKKSAQENITNPVVQQTVKALQRDERLPANVLDTTDEELDALKELAKTDKNIATAAEYIKTLIDLQKTEEEQTKEKVIGLHARRKLLAEEARNSRKYLEDTTNALKQSNFDTTAAIRALEQANYAGQIQGNLGNFNSSVATLFKGLNQNLIDAAKFTDQANEAQRAKYNNYIGLRGILAAGEQKGFEASGGSFVESEDQAGAITGEKLAKQAEQTIGIYKGIGLQCANTVREIAKLAGVKIPITNKPGDSGVVGNYTNPARANSFGSSSDKIINKKEDLRRGDVVQWADSYAGVNGVKNDNEITHVGIYLGDGKYYHHSRKAGGRITKDPGFKFAQGVRVGAGNNPYKILKESASSALGVRSGVGSKTSTQSGPLPGYSPVTSSFYYPGDASKEGGIKMQGERVDIKGRYLDGNSLAIATRTTDAPGGIPYGSTARLRNPANNKTVDVKVVDRGQLFSGRDIDSTSAVAKTLGLVADGLQKLEIKVISTPSGGVRSEYDLGVGKGTYDRKGNYTGQYGKRIGTKPGVRNERSKSSLKTEKSSSGYGAGFAGSLSGASLFAPQQKEQLIAENPLEFIDRQIKKNPGVIDATRWLDRQSKKVDDALKKIPGVTDAVNFLNDAAGIKRPKKASPQPARVENFSKPSAKPVSIFDTPNTRQGGADLYNNTVRGIPKRKASTDSVDKFLNTPLPSVKKKSTSDSAPLNQGGKIAPVEIPDTSPQFTNEARENNRKAFDQEIEANRLENERIDKEYALKAKGLTLQINRDQRANAIAVKRAKRQEARTIDAAEYKIADDKLELENEGRPSAQKEKKKRIAAVARDERERARRAREDIEDAIDETFEIKKSIEEVQKLATDGKLNPQQLVIYNQIKQAATDQLPYLSKRLKRLAEIQKASEQLYSKKLANATRDADKLINNEFEDSQIKTRESQIRTAEDTLSKVKIYQSKAGEFDLSKGDPLQLQAEIEKSRILIEAARINREQQEAVGKTQDPRVKAELSQQIVAQGESTFNQLANVDKRLALDKADRTSRGTTYNLDKTLEVTQAELDLRKLQNDLAVELQRLAPTYEDQEIIAKSAVTAAEEANRNRKELDNLRVALNADSSKKNTEANKQLIDAENKRHKDRLELIGLTLKNDLITQQFARRNNELAKNRAKLESALALSSAEAQLNTAKGETFQAAISQQRSDALERQQKKDEELSQLDEFKAKNPKLEAEYNTRKAQLERRYSFVEQAVEASFKKQQSDQLFGLNQNVRSAESERLSSTAGFLRSRGNSFDARDIEERIARSALANESLVKEKEFKELEAATFGASDEAREAVKKLREEYELLSKVKLENLEEEFSRFKGIATDTINTVDGVLGRWLRGQGGQGTTLGQDLLSILLAPLNAITTQIQQRTVSAISGVINNLLGGVTDDLNGAIARPGSAAASGSGGGGLINKAFDFLGGLFGFGGGGGSVFGSSGADSFIGSGAISDAFADGGVAKKIKHPGYGILNPHLQAARKDNGIYALADNEGVLTAEGVKRVGGAAGIARINQGKLIQGYINGGVAGAAPSAPSIPGITSYAPAPATQSTSVTRTQLELRYVSDGNSRFIHEDDFNAAMEKSQRQNAQALAEYDFAVQDRNFNSQAYRAR